MLTGTELQEFHKANEADLSSAELAIKAGYVTNKGNASTIKYNRALLASFGCGSAAKTVTRSVSAKVVGEAYPVKVQPTKSLSLSRAYLSTLGEAIEAPYLKVVCDGNTITISAFTADELAELPAPVARASRKGKAIEAVVAEGDVEDEDDDDDYEDEDEEELVGAFALS